FGIDYLRLCGRDCHRYSAPRFGWQAFGVAVVDLAPMVASIGRLKQAAARSPRPERPALTPEIPHRGINRLRLLAAHRHQSAARRRIRAGQNLFPRLATVRGLVYATLVVVVPQLSHRAGQNILSI